MYIYYVNNIFLKVIIELPKYIGINNYAIKIKK